MRIRRPHELDYATLRTRQRVPLQPFVFVRASVSKEMERKKHQLPQKSLEICVYDAQSTKEKWVCAREGLHGNFDGPDVIVVQKTT